MLKFQKRFKLILSIAESAAFVTKLYRRSIKIRPVLFRYFMKQTFFYSGLKTDTMNTKY